MREYMDNHHHVNPLFKTGDKWYEEQAFRAINQGLGRCIRHNRDYGAILLLDSRFQKVETRMQLSRWFRNSLQIASNEKVLLSELSRFFATCSMEFPRRASIKREHVESQQDWKVTSSVETLSQDNTVLIPQSLQKDQPNPIILQTQPSNIPLRSSVGPSDQPSINPSPVIPEKNDIIQTDEQDEETQSVGSMGSEEIIQSDKSDEPNKPNESIESDESDELNKMTQSDTESDLDIDRLLQESDVENPFISQAETSSLQILSHTNSVGSSILTTLSCPFCKEGIYATWNSTFLNLEFVKNLFDYRNELLAQHHLPPVFTEGDSMNVWTCAFSEIAPLLTHFCLDVRGNCMTVNHGENSSDVYIEADKTM